MMSYLAEKVRKLPSAEQELEFAKQELTRKYPDHERSSMGLGWIMGAYNAILRDARDLAGELERAERRIDALEWAAEKMTADLLKDERFLDVADIMADAVESGAKREFMIGTDITDEDLEAGKWMHCPKCNSYEVEQRTPDRCHYRECEDCGHQWDHM